MTIQSDVGVSKVIAGELDGLKNYIAQNSLEVHLANILKSQLQTSALSRESYYQELGSYRNNFVVNGIYDILMNDLLMDHTTESPITVFCNDKEVETEIKDLFEKIAISEVIQSILPDLLHYGSYAMKPIISNKKGIIGLSDDYYPNQVIAITGSKQDPLFYFVANNLTPTDVYRQSTNASDALMNVIQANTQRKKTKVYEFKDTSQVIYFSIDLGYTKLLLPEQDIQSMRDKVQGNKKLGNLGLLLPRSLKIKTPVGFIYPALDKLKDVLALDKFTVYKNIGDVLTPRLVGIPLPATLDVDKLTDITKRYDEVINSNIQNVNLTSMMNLETTLQDLAKVQVIPISGERSTPEQITFGREVGESSAAADAVQTSLERLLTTVGVPPEYWRNETSSIENLKTATRYAKKIKRISRNLARTLEHLALLHCSYKFPDKNIKWGDIKIQFRNNQNIDELQNLETQDLVITSIENAVQMVEDLNSLIAGSDFEIDKNLVIENIVSTLASAGSTFKGVFRKKGEEENKSQAGEVLDKFRNIEASEVETKELLQQTMMAGELGESIQRITHRGLNESSTKSQRKGRQSKRTRRKR